MRKLTNTEKGMLAMIILLIIGVIVRWSFVFDAVSESIQNLLSW